VPGGLRVLRLLFCQLGDAPEEDTQSHEKYRNANRSRPIQSQPQTVHVILLVEIGVIDQSAGHSALVDRLSPLSLAACPVILPYISAREGGRTLQLGQGISG